ncbi:MAG: VWA domain-containing protein, partial [Chloroflexota bacterium]
ALPFLLLTSSLPREYIFVLDRSGSMSGEPILQAVNALRACLRTLNSQDTFAILLFDDRLEWLAPQTAVTQAAIDQVDLRLSQVGGRGGTDILPALEAALLLPSLILPEKPQPARLVVFLTDGAVSAEEQTLKMTRLSIGNTRLFTFGVGSSVNRAFLQQLARIGRGESTFIALDEDIEEAILRFQDRIAFPLLTNLSLHAEGCQVWDIYPAQLPDLYADRPLEVIGRYKYTGDGDQPAHLVARGERAGTPIEVHSTLVVNPSNPEVLSRLWARARVDELLEQVELRQKPEHVARTEIIHLAMDASLLTKYTAFLAVDSVVNASSGRSQFIKVAQPLPEGLQEYSIFDNLANNPPMSAPMPANSANIHHLSDSSMLAEEDFLVSENQPAFSMPKFVGEAKNIAPKLLKRVRLANRSMELSAPNDAPSDAKNIFHELARSQQLNGSWKEDVEITAAALLAFVRSGHTTQKGHYRKLVQRAFTWLAETHAFGFAGFLRALALRELAQATQSPAHTAAFDAVMAGLPAPQSGLESTVFNILTNAPEAIPPMLKADSLDDLRLAVVTGSPCSQIAPELIRDDLGQALAAGLNSY